MKKAYIAAATMALGALMAQPALAKSPQISGGDMVVKSNASMQNQTLTVSGPNGFHKVSSDNVGTPRLSLMKDGQMADGKYNWQLTGSTGERVVTYKNSVDNGRGAAERGYSLKSVTESGTFTILNGVQVQDMEEAPAKQSTGAFSVPESRIGNR